MFFGCNSLTSLDLNNFKTSSVTDMNNIFSNCTKLKSLNIDNFDTSNVTTMKQMFFECYKLKEIKGLNKFNTKNITLY